MRCKVTFLFYKVTLPATPFSHGEQYLFFYGKLFRRASSPIKTGEPYFSVQFHLYFNSNSNLSNCQIVMKSSFSVSRSFTSFRMTCEEIDDKFSTQNSHKFHVETQINNNKNSLFRSFDRPFLKGRASRRRRRSPPQRRNSLTDKLLFEIRQLHSEVQKRG